MQLNLQFHCLTVHLFYKINYFQQSINKNANTVKMNNMKLVILFMHIELGLCDVTQPKMAALHSF